MVFLFIFGLNYTSMINLENLNIILFIIPIYQMLFYAVQLITLRKRNDPSRCFLGFVMLLMVVYLVINVSKYLGYNNIFQYLYFIQLPVLLAIIPTYYLYFASISKTSGGIFSKFPLVYYLPSIFIMLLNVVVMVIMSPDQTANFMSSEGFLPSNSDNAINLGVLIFLLGNVGFIAAQVIISIFHYLRVMHNLSNIRKSNSAYLPQFQVLWSHVILISVISFVILCSLMNLLSPDFNSFVSSVTNIGLLISGGLAGYFGLKQDNLYIEVVNVPARELKMNDVSNIEHKVDIKYTKTIIGDEEAMAITSQLQSCLVNDRPYLNKELSVNDLAKKIGINKQKLTYVINHVMKTNFYGILNKYRVLEAKELLKQPKNKNYNIHVISEMAGFKSKSSFNACFKKITGQTPSEFRKNN